MSPCGPAGVPRQRSRPLPAPPPAGLEGTVAADTADPGLHELQAERLRGHQGDAVLWTESQAWTCAWDPPTPRVGPASRSPRLVPGSSGCTNTGPRLHSLDQSPSQLSSGPPSCLPSAIHPVTLCGSSTATSPSAPATVFCGANTTNARHQSCPGNPTAEAGTPALCDSGNKAPERTDGMARSVPGGGHGGRGASGGRAASRPGCGG